MSEYKRKPNTKCSICSLPIYRRPIELELSSGKAYCSLACYGRSCRKETPCIVCGTLILASKNKKTCSRACANENRTGITYTGGRLKDNVHTQRLLKQRLIHERGSSCERCGYAIMTILQVHHRDRDRTHNVLMNLELICPNCHASEHYLKN